jgi:hypothetical protein
MLFLHSAQQKTHKTKSRRKSRPHPLKPTYLRSGTPRHIDAVITRGLVVFRPAGSWQILAHNLL